MKNLIPKVKLKSHSSGKPAMSLILTAVIGWILSFINGSYSANNDVWPLERPDGMPSIQSLEVMCGKDHMDVHLQFTQPFEGIVSSKGQYGDPRCVYVPPSTGKIFYKFRIGYDGCGTKPDLNGQFYENTVVVQYDKDLLEVWDEAKRLRCEWYNDYEKTASKPPMVIADLDVIQLDFRGDNVDCWMEIQHGKGPWAPPVNGIVPLGSTLTLVVAINDYRGEFDMRVKSCAANDNGGHGGHNIQLSDEHGCVLRPKMISRFLKAKIADERASVITYAFFHAFKFPDALSVHIKCKVEICRHGCLDHCQLADSLDNHHPLPVHNGAFDDFNSLKRQDSNVGVSHAKESAPATEHQPSSATSLLNDLLYDDKPIDDVPNETNYDDHQNPAALKSSKPSTMMPDVSMSSKSKDSDIHSIGHNNVVPMPRDNTGSNSPLMQPVLREHHHSLSLKRDPHERFPHGPRKLKDDIETNYHMSSNRTNNLNTSSSFQRRRRRSFVVSDKEVSNANVGVSGLYEVISEADLAFTPDKKQEAVTVFQGKIREEVVYGICLPVQGFSLIFVLMALCAIVSAIVAGFLLYRYQMQRQKQRALHQQHQRICHQRQQQHQYAGSAAEFAMTSLANWMTFRLTGSRQPLSNGTPQRQSASEHKS